MHSITWDCDRVLLYLPFVDFPIYWYGLFFALGIYLAQSWVVKNIVRLNLIDKAQIQNIIFYLIIGIVCGARLGDVFFYQNIQDLMRYPLDVFNLRAGGLSSHGGVLGFLITLAIISKRYKLPVFSLLSCMAAPTGILACFIRIGNFFNHEILGKAYQGFGSVVFLNPLDGSAAIARHPVVLYEAMSYLLISFILFKIQMKEKSHVGLALIVFFGSRIFLESFKEEQSFYSMPWGMTLGMLLSIPLVILGICLIVYDQKSRSKICNT
jgi:phosphatidylglycerol---prolipoprotein diacylglyceryl transferase